MNRPTACAKNGRRLPNIRRQLTKVVRGACRFFCAMRDSEPVFRHPISKRVYFRSLQVVPRTVNSGECGDVWAIRRAGRTAPQHGSCVVNDIRVCRRIYPPAAWPIDALREPSVVDFHLRDAADNVVVSSGTRLPPVSEDGTRSCVLR